MKICPTCTSAVPATSRFCGGCGAALEVSSPAPTQTSVPDESPRPDSRRTHGAGRVVTPVSGLESRFLPGEMIDGRYRIVGLIGRGGMGEVFRADDLKLGQPVALKFLPESLEASEDRLERFLGEVRIARQVTHANVCRVYDIGEFGGRHYLSMEFVDGEDLATLLRRIGRLEQGKAVEIARQICAGLAAAHARGIVHRDLKPANVMIDGMGHVRLTDFGLAALADGVQGAEIRAGTPDYMAPEQLAGHEVTPRSDLYSLGLVLYEMFTGKPAYRSQSLQELRRMLASEAPRSPSTLVSGLDPVIERVILRCLEKDPKDRPSSALAVSAALPGGDPLAEALAAGETPSPELVAAAGQAGGLRPAVAAACFGLFLLGVAGLLALADRVQLTGRIELPKAPAALVLAAEAVLDSVGHDAPRADAVWNFTVDRDLIQHVQRNDRSPARWDDMESIRPGPVGFWYRTSPNPLVPLRFEGNVSWSNPPPNVTGMARVVLDPRGRLLELEIQPPQIDDGEAGVAVVDWAPLFAAAGFDDSEFRVVAPSWNPPVAADHRAAWEGTVDDGTTKLRLEAASYRGRPVWFRVIAPWTRAERDVEPEVTGGGRVVNAILLALFVVILAVGVTMARRNLRLGRTDRRGAFRIGLYILVSQFVGWALKAHHVATLAEAGLIFEVLQAGLLLGGIVWVVYLALEPYVRRFWPQAIVSWSRVLAGRLRDGLVGRDVLFGCLAGVVMSLLLCGIRLAPQMLGDPGVFPAAAFLTTDGGWANSVAQLLLLQPSSLFTPIALFFVVLIARIVTRSIWVAALTPLALMSTVIVVANPGAPSIWVLGALYWVVMITVTVRLGLLAACIAVYLTSGLDILPLTTDGSAWYAPLGWTLLALHVALAAYGLWSALAGRSLFTDPLDG